MQKTKFQLFMSMLTNPVLLLIHILFWKELYELCMYGGTARRLPILGVCGVFFLVWFILFLVRAHGLPGKRRVQDSELWPADERDTKQTLLLYWKIAAVVTLLGFTIYYARGIAHSATGYNGKLAWYLDDLRRRKEIELVHDNIYEDGLGGIFEDLREELDLPGEDELFVAGSFRLEFAVDGEIEIIEASLSGKREDNSTGTWMLSYDRARSGKMTVYCDHVTGETDETRELRRMEPLFEVMERIDLEKETADWRAGGEKKFGILYYGIRSWDPGEQGICFVDSAGNTMSDAELAGRTGRQLEHVVNYTVSLYLPGAEEGSFVGDQVYVPKRFVPVSDMSRAGADNVRAESLWRKAHPEEAKEQDLASGNVTSGNVGTNVSTQLDNGNIVYFLDEKTGYELEVVDAALGSRFYALNKTTDGGRTWSRLNPDPYQNGTGAAAEMRFTDEKLGFISLSHSGGMEAELFRTEDGGLTFSAVTFPEIQVSLGDDGTYNPFDFPGMPWEEDGKLFVEVGQGQDGDYDGGAKALYESEDRGITWNYVEETE